MTPLEIINEARIRGLSLEPRGDKLAVSPAGVCPNDFRQILLRHKVELINYLESRRANLPADQRPWVHVARQVLSGEFEGGHRSLIESLIIGLRSINHPACQHALARLKQHYDH